MPNSECRTPKEIRSPKLEGTTDGAVVPVQVSDFGLPSSFDNSAFGLMTIRVVLPFHLRNLARVEGEVRLDVAAPVTVRAVLDALEARYPVLRGTIRDHGTLKRRPFVRYFACKEDLSLDPPETPLPEAVVSGEEPFLIIGALAGG
jgi:molybdopterin synthase sulfur carrier subunit